ncbi:MAG: type II toxin-antitoxin system ParD family antitoxin [Thermococcus sp.]|uniref:Transcriptional regulator n=1 Tax=Thermococcus guaymasensis DSM 11113 TaxID=1432656 RepID=A0A0X1KIK2_9EURY|nr:type II toxin-antitoxin system ParD family antitoxin [Thermococcus guaymasensis]AJC71083.1 transcriptional regulator [Thermococcus guaymasensis DSM 11113]MCD6523626.1 type II toxin-antitoxin system ParD family antitoxin [Thermococcus sp.]
MTKMRIISVQVPQSYVNAMDQLVKRGLYPNRSEVIRAALREFLKKEMNTEIQVDEVPEYVIK